MRSKLFSLSQTADRLYEARYFVRQMRSVNIEEFRWNLNAFLSSSRSVTFVLQHSMSDFERFHDWWKERQQLMRNDRAMKFFLDLRNISQKRGMVRYVSTTEDGLTWSHRFVGHGTSIPHDVSGLCIADACELHLSKLAEILMAFAEAFPYHADPHKAATEAGMASLGLTIDDLCLEAGFPFNYFSDIEIPIPGALRLLRRELEPFDIEPILEIALRGAEISALYSRKSVQFADMLAATATNPRYNNTRADFFATAREWLEQSSPDKVDRGD